MLLLWKPEITHFKALVNMETGKYVFSGKSTQCKDTTVPSYMCQMDWRSLALSSTFFYVIGAENLYSHPDILSFGLEASRAPSAGGTGGISAGTAAHPPHPQPCTSPKQPKPETVHVDRQNNSETPAEKTIPLCEFKGNSFPPRASNSFECWLRDDIMGLSFTIASSIILASTVSLIESDLDGSPPAPHFYFIFMIQFSI